MCDVMRKYEDMARTQGLKQGLEQGLEQGLKQGMAEEKIAIAKKLIASGTFTDAQISEFTGLTQEKVAAIRNHSAA